MRYDQLCHDREEELGLQSERAVWGAVKKRGGGGGGGEDGLLSK